MNASVLESWFRFLSSTRRCALWILALAQVVPVGASEFRLSGLFSDQGTAVTPASGLNTSEFSLQRLLRLDFDDASDRAGSVPASHVEFTEDGDTLLIRVIGSAGAVVRKVQGGLESRASSEGRQVLLRLSDQRYGDDSFVLIFQPAAEDRLLQVKVVRLHPTVLGVGTREIGTFYFPRLAGKEQADAVVRVVP